MKTATFEPLKSCISRPLSKGTHLNAVGLLDSEHFAILLRRCDSHHIRRVVLLRENSSSSTQLDSRPDPRETGNAWALVIAWAFHCRLREWNCRRLAGKTAITDHRNASSSSEITDNSVDFLFYIPSFSVSCFPDLLGTFRLTATTTITAATLTLTTCVPLV